MTYFQIIEKLKFLFYAKNAHGLHSPFVFEFYNEVKLKAKKINHSAGKLFDFNKRQTQIIVAIIHYLKIENAFVLDKNRYSIQQLFLNVLEANKIYTSDNLVVLPKEEIKFDLIYISKSLLIKEDNLLAKLRPFISERSAVIIPHIHASKNSLDRWKSLIKNDSVRVSLDLFFIGILLFRKESTKQNFLLRF